ncbi:hypothetical protein F5884DRAFT_903510 [Xylogone sp. PMI_703]|nr:hypothetical protein F5884DRAFT_903510 [Xylogone sp. PMI_703]
MAEDIGTQMGILFGFVGAFIVTLTLYSIWWRAKNKRDIRKVEEKQAELVARGFGPKERRDFGDEVLGLLENMGHTGTHIRWNFHESSEHNRFLDAHSTPTIDLIP